MDFDKANEWLRDKNRQMDLEVLVDASKKWKGKKLVVQEANTHIPTSCKSGSDILEFLSLFKEALDLTINRIQKDLKKHLELVEKFLSSCVEKQSILKSNTELQNLVRFVKQVESEFKKLDSKFTKFNVNFRLQSTFPDYSVESLINNNKHRWESPSIEMMEGLPVLKIITLDHTKNQQFTNVVFTKNELSDLAEFIVDLSKSDFLRDLKTMWDIVSIVDKQFTKTIHTLLDKFETQGETKSIKDPERRIISGMLDNLQYKDQVKEYEHKVAIDGFQDNVLEFVMILRQVVKLMERTDSWMLSKNV